MDQFKPYVETPAEDQFLDLTGDKRTNDQEAAKLIKQPVRLNN